jgi:hypothetical protein
MSIWFLSGILSGLALNPYFTRTWIIQESVLAKRFWIMLAKEMLEFSVAIYGIVDAYAIMGDTAADWMCCLKTLYSSRQWLYFTRMIWHGLFFDPNNRNVSSAWIGSMPAWG